MGYKLIIGITAPQSVVLLHGQLKYFKSLGYDMYLMAPEDERTREICEVENATLLPIKINREINPLKDIKSFGEILRHYRKVKPDIVNLGTPKVSFLGMMAAKLAGVRTRIYTCRGFRFEHESGTFRKMLISIERITVSCATKVICISPSVRELGIKKKIFKASESVVVNKGSSNGVNLSLFNPNEVDRNKVDLLQKELNLEGKFVFGFLGRIVKRKGFEELLEAFDKLYQEDKSLHLLVVGRAYYDQIERSHVEAAEKHPGISMVGLVPYKEVSKYLALMDVFVLPAYWEGFGNVLIQAASMGLPIISTDVTGCRDAVANGYNGDLIEEKNTTALKEKMKEFKYKDEKRNKYAENSIRWAKNFESDVIWEGLDKVYKEAAVGNPKS